MSILVVGSVALDTVKTPFGRRNEILGGSATYFSISAGFFEAVNLVAVVGKDFPKEYLGVFRKRGVDLKGLEVKKGKTFRWVGRYGFDFNKAETIKTSLNVFSSFSPRIPYEYKRCKFVFLANIDPQLQQIVLEQIRTPKFVACDTMNYWIEHKRKYLLEVLKQVDMFLLNDSEARQLTQESNLLKAVKEICRLGPRYIVIKKGEHGALLFCKDSFFCVPALLVDSVVDPTGAGDTFAGGLIGYLSRVSVLNRDSFKKAVIYGTIMASFAVEDFSVNKLISIKNRDISKRLREFKKLTTF